MNILLYPRNTEPELTPELFKNPGSEYRGTPFWAWNCKLEKEELLRQLEVLKQMGMGGAHMHVRTGMATPYLSDEHMELIRACVEKCRDEGMLAWLYDEDRWPSGAAGGIVTKDPEYRSCYLRFTTTPYGAPIQQGEHVGSTGNRRQDENGFLLACYDVLLDQDGCLISAHLIPEDMPAQGQKWYAYVETALPNPWFNNQTYANTLDKKTMQRFIDVTYERYLQTIGGDFGGVVPAIFTDEPQFARKGTLGFAKESKNVYLPWSKDIPDTFQAAYDEDIIAHLPELFWELPDNRRSVIRYHYHDHIAERFAQAFADQCGKWCSDHNLMLTGHMMEEPTLESQTAALGEAMRSYRSFQLPGIDMLCAKFELTTAKQAQSAAHQYGRPGVLSELYGVTGWDFDFRGHKLHGDWQAALGVTVRVQHLAWVSMKGEAKRDYPASISYQSPWWRDYSVVEDHFARVNTALTRGKPLVRVGVVHPVESYWLHWGPAEQTYGIRRQMDDNFRNVTQWLLTGSVDFDFISESLLPGLCEQGGAPLRVGEMAYDAVIVPGCETLRSSTLDRLEAFQQAGGRLIFMGDAPALENATPSERGAKLWSASTRCVFSREALLDAVQSVRTLEIRNTDGTRTNNLLHQLRRDGEGLWLFVAHATEPYNKDIPQPQDVRITVNGNYGVQVYDTQTGDIRAALFESGDGRTTIHATLYDYDSLLLRLSEKQQECTAHESHEIQTRSISVPELVRYTLDEPNVLLLDKAEFALDDEAYQTEEELLRIDNFLRKRLGWPNRDGAVVQPWAMPEETVTHTVRLRFTVRCRYDLSWTKLALEDADAAKISVNGIALSAAPDGWYVDKAIGTVALPALHAGENVIEVVLPFGRRTNVEWCYLLGTFGVEVRGTQRVLIHQPETLGFDDITRQELPHYTGNITYSIPFDTTGGSLRITVPHYRGAAVRVALDDASAGYVIYPPYRLDLGRVTAGSHVLKLTLLGNRQNGFGPLHRTDVTNTWIGPDAWRTTGARWTDSYRFTPVGILTAPYIEEY